MTFFYCLLNIAVIAGVGYWLWQQEPALPLKRYFLPALILKVAAGILLGLFYQVYFGGGDARLFQSQSDFVTEYARVSPISYLRLLLTRQFESETLRTSMVFVWYSNSYFMVMLLSFLNFLTGGHFFLNSLYFSLFCFWGLWQLVKVLSLLFPEQTIPAVLAFLFFPSVVFWASGISKEAVFLGSLGWFIAACLRLIYRLTYRVLLNLVAIIIAGYLLWKIKFYFAALVFALMFGYGLVVFLTRHFPIFQKNTFKILLFCISVLISGLIISNWKEVLKLDYFAAQLVNSNTILTERSTGKSVVNFPDLEPTLISFGQHSPAAVYYSLMRPFLWEEDSLFFRLAGLENLILAGLLIFTLITLIRKPLVRLNLGALVILIYVLVLAVLIGLSTPNIGSLNRYRVAFLPFLVFLLLSIIYKYRLTGRLRP